MRRECECGAKEGQFHVFGCRRERCPFCEAENGCDCCYDRLGLKSSAHPFDLGGLSQEVYDNGLSDEQRAAWRAAMETRGRVPFVDAPLMCGRCGKLWPDFFMVQDAAWEYYTGPELRDAVVCERCFDQLRRAINKHQPRPDWVPTEAAMAEYRKAWRAGDRKTLRRLDPKKFGLD